MAQSGLFRLPMYRMRELFVDALRSGLWLSPSAGVEPMEQIVDLLSRQPALLVLDNFEQLVENGTAGIQQLLDRVPSLRCLVTSRRRLDLSGEREFVVPPLSIPNAGDCPEKLLQCESIQLFADRAQSVKPDFQITAQNGPSISDLCARLQGSSACHRAGGGEITVANSGPDGRTA